MKNLLSILLALSLFSIISGCSEHLTYEITEDAKQVQPEITTVKIYLEASWSMKGFVEQINPNPNYKIRTIVPYLITECRSKLNSEQVLYTFITDSPQVYPYPDSQFKQQLWNGQILSGQQSRIHNIIKHVIDSIKPNELSILISDFILDLGGGLTFRNRDQVTTLIYDQLATKNNLSVSIFQYLSDFNGSYYYSQNNTQPYLNRELHNRPFYICLFGKPEIIQYALSKGILEDYDKEFYWGIEKNKVNPTLVSHPREGEWLSYNGDIEFESNPNLFTIGVNLSSLPQFTQEKDYLQSNLKISNINAGGSIKVYLREDYKKRNRAEIKKLSQNEEFTHFFEVTLTNVTNTTGNIKIYLPFNQNNWLSSVNLDRDLDSNNHRIPMSNIEKKTFSLKYITDAFDKKFDTKPVLFEIILKQNKL